ncbi:HD domain-containing protein [Geomonas sp. RF6]|uniref:HD domain-containing phosphohydrolase n=1 Tax=Geomonas sp. RF6 TaxID=2897342 RepID=UPI001E43E379|nr:HD domain-containing phosphohydrolase [Geomonas sp. RF6]UFS68770.1 HD domain-containing protein [Geomonas sp. RF6]
MDVHAPLYNSRITDSYLKLVKKRYPFVNIGELLAYAGMKEYEVADQGHWFTQDQVNRFQEKLIQMTSNPHIAREAGRYCASVDALGVMRQYILGFIGISHTFQMTTKTASNFTRSAMYEAKAVSSTQVEVVVTPLVEGLERPFQCENRAGFFEAIVLMFSSKMPTVSHPECVFNGGKVCRYVITWENTLPDVLKRVHNILTPLLILLNVTIVLGHNWGMLERSLTGSLILALLITIAAQRSELRGLFSSLSNTMATKDSLLEQININYNNALLTNDVAQGLGSYSNADDILADVLRVMQKRLKYDRGVIFLANKEGTRLVFHGGYGYSDEHIALYKKFPYHLDRPRSKGMFLRAYREQRPFLINDVEDIKDSLSNRSLAFARKMGAVSFICCPIICERKSMGIVAVDNVTTKQALVESDIGLLMGIASVVGISIRNAELTDSRVRVFSSILHALAASIDARDPLTAGHSEKVTEYSLGICRELELQPEFCEVIRVAALLHDYGKIGVPDTILKKKGKLTQEEYEVVKAHSLKTKEILAKINFEGPYRDVPAVAGAHHEKLDGSGYPCGMKGSDIPLGARIIAVADYFEAITAKRHYRDPMPVAEAFSVLYGACGYHLEERLVEALRAYYVRTYPEDFFDQYVLPEAQLRRPPPTPEIWEALPQPAVTTPTDPATADTRTSNT